MVRKLREYPSFPIIRWSVELSCTLQVATSLVWRVSGRGDPSDPDGSIKSFLILRNGENFHPATPTVLDLGKEANLITWLVIKRLSSD